MLARDQNCMYSDWYYGSSDTLIFNSDLNFSIWTNPWHDILLSALKNPICELVCQLMSQWHQFFCLIRSITNHKSLISSSNIFDFFIYINGISDFWGLLIECYHNGCILIVKTLIHAIISDFFNSLPHYLLVHDVCL